MSAPERSEPDYIRLNHPFQWHKTLDVLEVGKDISVRDAAILTRGSGAVNVDDLITHDGGGWYTVHLQAGPKRVQGRDAAVRALRRQAKQ